MRLAARLAPRYDHFTSLSGGGLADESVEFTGGEQFYPDGVDLAAFIAANKARLSDRHVLYILKANTKGDSRIFKIGKSTVGVQRLLSYQHVYGFKQKGSPQSGAKLYWLKVVPAREPGEGGQRLVERMEKALKLTMLASGADFESGRGSERFKATKAQVAEAVDNFDDVWAEYNKDFKRTAQRRAPHREATTRGCDCELVSKKTQRGGRKYSCKPVVKYVPAVEQPLVRKRKR